MFLDYLFRFYRLREILRDSLISADSGKALESVQKISIAG